MAARGHFSASRPVPYRPEPSRTAPASGTMNATVYVF